MKIFTVLLSLAAFISLQNHALSMSVRGRVRADSGEPLVYVNVFFPDDLSGSVTDKAGRFEFYTHLQGDRELIVTHIGYKKVSRRIHVTPDMPEIAIEMEKEVLEVQGITVTASSFTVSEEEGVTLSAMDVVSTAGAAADIMRAIQTFSGVNTTDDGAGLFVRGGDVQETQVLLDGGILKHPYKYESMTGGYFGTFSPFLLAGTFFSSGGFSAKYGNALSGVLAMESLGMPEKRQFDLGLGLASTSLAMDLPITSDRFGIRFSGNKSATDLFLRLNGVTGYFSRAPLSDDGNLSLHYQYPGGMLKSFIFMSRNRIGVEARSPGWQGVYSGDETNSLVLLNWRHTLDRNLLIHGTLATNRFTNDQSIGIMDLGTRDQSNNLRIDLEYMLGDKWTLFSGMSHQQIGTRFTGTVPRDPNDIEGMGERLNFSGLTRSDVSGAYIEGQVRPISKLFLVAGVRTDFHHQVQSATADPRFSMVFQLNPQHALKFAAGCYHEFPDMFYYDPQNGNENLHASRALHAVLGWEFQAEGFQARAEVYNKRYDGLVLDDEMLNYSNMGEGFSRGVDIFIKQDAGPVTGWAAYSFLQSERKEKLYHTRVPTDYDITHNFKIASKLNLSAVWGVSISTRYSSGCPYHTGYGEWNAARGPAYILTDLSLSRIMTLFGDNFSVIYLSIGNVLGRENIVRYTYSSDYSEVHKQKSYMKRSLYFGCNVSF
jgi:vitamin B12 transporter